MSAWRRALVPVVVVSLLVVLDASARAQFGNILKKPGPKPASPVSAPPPELKAFGAGVTPEEVERLLKALKARAAAFETVHAIESANKKAENDAGQARAQRMMAAMEKQSACEQAAMEKDPRYKEVNRLSDLRNKAQDRGDDATADKLGEQFAALNDQVEAAAKKACTDPACIAKAKEASAHQKMLAEARATAAKARTPDEKAAADSQVTMLLAMIDGEAEMKCGPMGAAMPTEPEQAATDAASQKAADAKDAAEEAGRKAGEFTADELGRLMELAAGVCGGGATPATADSKAAIQPRCRELQAAMNAASGQERSSSRWRCWPPGPRRRARVRPRVCWLCQSFSGRPARREWNAQGSRFRPTRVSGIPVSSCSAWIRRSSGSACAGVCAARPRTGRSTARRSPRRSR